MYGYDIFHDDLMQSLINTVHNGACSHAYIFEGDAGLATGNAARLFAAALCCTNSEIAPCNSCSSCIEAKADTNPDIVYIRPEKNKKSIGVEDMHNVEADAGIKPFAAKRKVYIIENGALMTEAAQNVFLKTLEEPPSYAAFIIVTENAETLLQTIRSRAVIVHFPNVSDSVVREYIEKKYPAEDTRLDFLVRYCAGVPMTADKVIADEDFEAIREESLKKLHVLFSGKIVPALDLQKFAEENRDSLPQILDFWFSFARDILLLQTGGSEGIINVDKKEALRSLCARIEPSETVRVMDRLITAQKMTARYVSAKAVMLWLAL